MLHCFCMKTTSLWLSMNESTTCATFWAEQRDSGRTKVPPNFVCVTTGGSYSFVGRFQSFATCSCGSIYLRIGGFTLSSSTSMAGIARSKLDLPVRWRRGNLFGMCRFVHRGHGVGSTLITSVSGKKKFSRRVCRSAGRPALWSSATEMRMLSPIVNSALFYAVMTYPRLWPNELLIHNNNYKIIIIVKRVQFVTLDWIFISIV